MITNKIARAKCASNSTSTVMVSSYLGSPRTFRGWIKVDSYRFRVYTQEYIITPHCIYINITNKILACYRICLVARGRSNLRVSASPTDCTSTGKSERESGERSVRAESGVWEREARNVFFIY